MKRRNGILGDWISNIILRILNALMLIHDNDYIDVAFFNDQKRIDWKFYGWFFGVFYSCFLVPEALLMSVLFF